MHTDVCSHIYWRGESGAYQHFIVFERNYLSFDKSDGQQEWGPSF